MTAAVRAGTAGRAVATLLVIVGVGIGALSSVAGAGNPPPPVPARAPNPTTSTALGSLLSLACVSAPTGPACENEVIVMLDAARAHEGFGAYALPAGFTDFAPDAQLLTLANLDRGLYDEAPIVGTAHTLNVWSATTAAAGHPQAVPHLVDGRPLGGYAELSLSGSFPNVLVAYFVWMYDDGVGGPNASCVTAAARGCWSHRQVWLTESGIVPLVLGVGSAEHSGTLSISALVASIASTSDVVFTTRWRSLVALGAGRNDYSTDVVPVLPPAPVRVKVTPAPGQITLAWHEPKSTEPLKSFFVVYRKRGDAESTYVQLAADHPSYTAYNLTTGVAYNFAISAEDADGSSLTLVVTARAG